MTRINTNISSLVAQNRLQSNNNDLNTALTRLSTGLRINTGADDPAGLIASEALRSEITSLGKSINNTQRASQIVSTADSALGEVSSLLNDVRGLVTEAANSGALSDEEIAANQLQIDSSLEAINRISQTTTFQGKKLLDGSLDFQSDIGSVASVRDANIHQASLGTSGQMDVEVVIDSAATQAEATAGSSAFTDAANATADTGDVRVAQFDVGGGTDTISVTGDSNFSGINVVDDQDAGTGTASYDSSTGEITVTADFTTGGTAAADDIQAAINELDGFAATGANGATGDSNDEGSTVASAAADTLLTVDAANAGAAYNNVSIEFIAGDAGDGNSADYDSDQKVLTVTVDPDAPQSADDIASAIDSHTVDGEAAGTALFSASGLTDASVDIGNTNEALQEVSTGTTGGEVLADDLVFELSGSSGAETFDFAAGTSASQISDALNLVSDSTGVAASYSGGELAISSTDYGSEAKLNIDVISEGAGGSFEENLSATRATGTDITASVNGAQADGEGNTLSINTSALNMSVSVDEGSSTNFSFSITGGGAQFQLGPDVTSNQQARLGIASVSTGQLGGASGRLYELGSGQAKSLTNDVNGAAEVIDDVINKVASTRGRLGAFQSTTLESNLASLTETKANLQEAESSIRDADFAEESAKLTRAQVLVQSSTNVLSMANQNPRNVLSLLR